MSYGTFEQRPSGGIGRAFVYTFGAVAIASMMSIFASGSQFGEFHSFIAPTPAAARLAAAIQKLETPPKVSQEMLDEVFSGLVQKAKAGDVEAAAFVFELAHRQQNPQSCETDCSVAKVVNKLKGGEGDESKEKGARW